MMRITANKRAPSALIDDDDVDPCGLHIDEQFLQGRQPSDGALAPRLTPAALPNRGARIDMGQRPGFSARFGFHSSSSVTCTQRSMLTIARIGDKPVLIDAGSLTNHNAAENLHFATDRDATSLEAAPNYGQGGKRA